jgi:hypothetical protein
LRREPKEAMHSNESREEKLSREYLQQACLLAAAATSAELTEKGHNSASPEPLISKVVAQHIMQSGRHAGYVPANFHLGHDRKADDEESSSNARSAPVYLPCCRECGAPLQPGYAGTTVRLESAGNETRAQRRRNSKLASKPTPSHKQASQPSLLAEFCQRDPSLIPKNVRNYLSIRCGVCRAQSYAPGLDRRKKHFDANNASKRMIPTYTSGAKVPTQKSKSLTVKKKAESCDDFIALGSPKRSSGLGTTLSRCSNKKKKPNQLMDFLSSLNDR